MAAEFDGTPTAGPKALPFAGAIFSAERVVAGKRASWNLRPLLVGLQRRHRTLAERGICHAETCGEVRPALPLTRRHQGAQTAGALGRSQLAEGLGFNLADPLTGDIELLPDFLERVLPLASDAEA